MVKNPKRGKMPLREAYPTLSNLIGAYLHQDWLHVYDWEDKKQHYQPVVRFFKTHNPPSFVDQATNELKQFLAEEHDEEHLEDYLYHHFVLGLNISYLNITNKEWLEDVLKILEEPMEKTKKEWIPNES
jgi:CdiI immunity protein